MHRHVLHAYPLLTLPALEISAPVAYLGLRTVGQDSFFGSLPTSDWDTTRQQ